MRRVELFAIFQGKCVVEFSSFFSNKNLERQFGGKNFRKNKSSFWEIAVKARLHVKKKKLAKNFFPAKMATIFFFFFKKMFEEELLVGFDPDDEDEVEDEEWDDDDDAFEDEDVESDEE